MPLIPAAPQLAPVLASDLRAGGNDGQPTPAVESGRQVGLSDRPVYVAEYGHGARKGRIIREETVNGRLMYTVKFDDGMPDRRVFCDSVFSTKSDADLAS